MGFQNVQTQSVTWAKISQGKVVLTSKVPMEGYVERINKMNATVYELFYNSFEGRLIDVELDSEANYGPQWKLTFDDNGKTVILTSGYENRYTRTLLNRLLNKAIDFTKEISINPYSFIPDGEEYTLTGCNVIQFGKKLNPRYDVKTELPQPEETIVKKQKTFNYNKQMEFFENAIEKELKPRLSGVKIADVKVDANGFIDIESDINEPDFYRDLN